MTTALLVLSLLVTLSCISLLIFGSRPPPSGTWDAIIVAGCRVLPDGTPSPALARRVTMAVELYDSGLAPEVVFTGGLGQHGMTEASSAARYATQLGLDIAAIQLESDSTNTRQNASYSALLIGSDARVLVVTDVAHALRCQRLFRRHFRSASAVGAPLPFKRAPLSALRELAANVLETIR